jgi:hypothetical protein
MLIVDLKVNSLIEQTMQTQIGGLDMARVQHSTYPEEKGQRLSRPVRLSPWYIQMYRTATVTAVR